MVRIGDRLFFSSVEVTTPPKRGAGGDGSAKSRRGPGRRPSVRGHDGWPARRRRRARRRPNAPPRAASTSMAATSGCRSPSIDRTAARCSTASIRRREKPRKCSAPVIISVAWRATPDDRTLHAVSWGSRLGSYGFGLDPSGTPHEREKHRPPTLRVRNRSHYIKLPGTASTSSESSGCCARASPPCRGVQGVGPLPLGGDQSRRPGERGAAPPVSSQAQHRPPARA